MTYDFDSMSNDELNSFAMNSKFKSTPKKVVKEEKREEKKEVSLKEIDNKIKNLKEEEKKLRSEFKSASNDRKRGIISRINSINDEYTFLGKLIKSIIKAYSVSDKNIEEMTNEEIREEMDYLLRVNDEIRSEYKEVTNTEIRGFVDKHLEKVKSRYIALENSVKKAL